jgi:hypothetical protein
MSHISQVTVQNRRITGPPATKLNVTPTLHSCQITTRQTGLEASCSGRRWQTVQISGCNRGKSVVAVRPEAISLSTSNATEWPVNQVNIFLPSFQARQLNRRLFVKPENVWNQQTGEPALATRTIAAASWRRSASKDLDGEARRG